MAPRQRRSPCISIKVSGNWILSKAFTATDYTAGQINYRVCIAINYRDQLHLVREKPRYSNRDGDGGTSKVPPPY